MLSLEDCIALSTLSEKEISAIAEHEHLPMIAATELGNYLIQTPDGINCVSQMIRDDIHAAQARGDTIHELALKLVLRTYLHRHPIYSNVIAREPARSHSAVRDFLKKMPPK